MTTFDEWFEAEGYEQNPNASRYLMGCAWNAALDAQAAQAEPVAWRIFDSGKYEYSDYLCRVVIARHKRYGRSYEPLYAAPQPERQPLTDEQIAEMALQEELFLICDGIEELTEIIRAVELAHGIGGKP